MTQAAEIDMPVLFLAVRHGLEWNNVDAELLGEGQQQILGVKRAIEVIAALVLAARVVAPNDHVRAAIILADDGVLDRLAGAADLRSRNMPNTMS
jgi:hypothetical protein